VESHLINYSVLNLYIYFYLVLLEWRRRSRKKRR